MNGKDIDRLMADDERIVPSSGFADSVMQAVEADIRSMRPLPFPWLRAMPGIVAAIVCVVVGAWNAAASMSDATALALFDEQFERLAGIAGGLGIQWILLVTAITVLAALLPAKLARIRRGVAQFRPDPFRAATIGQD